MLRMWTYDIAREQAPTLDHLRQFCRMTVESGFDAIGLYLEHRFAYPSAPWAAGRGAVHPDHVRTLQDEFPQLQIVPFINLLGHVEGFLYTEEGKHFREELFQGLQACPCNPAFVEFCNGIVDDTIEIFRSNLIHIGGDETWQLGVCPECRKVSEEKGKGYLYGEHFGPLAKRVSDAGRRAGVWGDMFKDHPDALDYLPKDTLIFDWQYFGSCRETAQPFLDKGFEVVGCPALHTYNATWLHIPQSEENVRQIAQDARDLSLHGVCVTTWECALFGAYDTLTAALKACAGILASGNENGSRHTEPEKIRNWIEDLKFEFPPEMEGHPEEWEDQMSLATGIATNIIGHAVHSRILSFELIGGAEKAEIIYWQHGERAVMGSLPPEQAESTVVKLKTLAGMRLYPKTTPQSGQIKGVAAGVAFEYRVSFRVEGGFPIMSFACDDKGPGLWENAPEGCFLKAYLQESERYEEWARLMGVELQECGGPFAFSGIRSSLKCRLLLYSNPFLAWMHHGDELSGEVGDKALAIFERAFGVAPNEATKDITLFARSAVEFVRIAELARQHYAKGEAEAAIGKLSLTRQLFDDLERAASRTNQRIGGSLADIERCRTAKRHVEVVIQRIRQYGDGSLGYLPAFEIITHPKFVPHDQASWWLINRWANQ